jgi:hypothetical protein
MSPSTSFCTTVVPRRATCSCSTVRNSIISQLLTWQVYVPARGGNLITLGGPRTVTAVGHREYCVDEQDSDETGAGYRECSDPATTTRGERVTGKQTVDWKITLRRL